MEFFLIDDLVCLMEVEVMGDGLLYISVAIASFAGRDSDYFVLVSSSYIFFQPSRADKQTIR